MPDLIITEVSVRMGLVGTLITDKTKVAFFLYRTVVSYDTLELPFFTAPAISTAEKIGVYDSLDADVIQSYMEYSLASLLFFTLKEGACSEQSSRMTAMDSASKNAGMFRSIDVVQGRDGWVDCIYLDLKKSI